VTILEQNMLVPLDGEPGVDNLDASNACPTICKTSRHTFPGAISHVAHARSSLPGSHRGLLWDCFSDPGVLGAYRAGIGGATSQFTNSAELQ